MISAHDSDSPASEKPREGNARISPASSPMGSDLDANPQRIGNTLAMVSIIYSAILMGAVLFHVIAFLLHEFDAMQPVFGNLLVALVIDLSMTLASLLVASRTYTRQVEAAAAQDNDVAKLRAWSVASIVRIAIFDASMMLNAVAMLLTGSLWFGSIFLLQLVLLFTTARPTESRLRSELRV